MIRHNGIEIDRANMRIKVGVKVVRHRVHDRRTIERVHNSVNDANHRFKVMQHLLLVGPIGATRRQLFDLIYGDDPDGGPLTSYRIFDVRFNQWKKHFCALGVRLVSDKRSGEMFFRLVPDVV